MITKEEFKEWKGKSEKEAKNEGYNIKIVNRKFHNLLKWYFIITVIIGLSVLLFNEVVINKIPFLSNITDKIMIK